MKLMALNNLIVLSCIATLYRSLYCLVGGSNSVTRQQGTDGRECQPKGRQNHQGPHDNLLRSYTSNILLCGVYALYYVFSSSVVSNIYKTGTARNNVEREREGGDKSPPRLARAVVVSVVKSIHRYL